MPGCGRHPERAGVGSPQQGAVGLVEAGQAAGRGRWRPAARYISGAADLPANGGKLPDGIPETARNQLAAILRRDADGLIAITTTD